MKQTLDILENTLKDTRVAIISGGKFILSLCSFFVFVFLFFVFVFLFLFFLQRIHDKKRTVP